MACTVQFHFDQITQVVSVNIQFAIVWFLSLCFFFVLGVTRTGRTGGPILTIYTSYDDVFPPTDVPFWSFDNMLPS